ncbi:MAG: radical SAM protein [Archaeoglobus sp.]|nr:radical SAM protein [Archaeoglobus sp.]
MGKMNYQRFLTPGFKPFDPLKLAAETEKLVTRKTSEGQLRKYTSFYSVPVYRGIATGYAVGCCLRCIYCWSGWSRDFPERFGRFYSPEEAANELLRAAREGIVYSDYWRKQIPSVNKLRISGCEPTIGKEHLVELIELTPEDYLFILETNGILLGNDRNYVKRIAEFKDRIYVRVSFKAATPEGFTKRTGAIGKYYDLPFKALRYLLDEGVYARAAAMTDPKTMPREERDLLIQMLGEIDRIYLRGGLEEEVIDPYDITIKRLKAYEDEEYARVLEKEILSGSSEK